MPIKGTVFGDMLAEVMLAKIDDTEFVRTIAVAHMTMPLSMVRLSAGRETLCEATQASCFVADANSIFTEDNLLTNDNAGYDRNAALMTKLGLRQMDGQESKRKRRYVVAG